MIEEHGISSEIQSASNLNNHRKESEEQQRQQSDSVGSIDEAGTKYFIQINRKSLIFGRQKLFPGSIQQLDIQIKLKDGIIQQDKNPSFLLRLITRCSNIQFDDHEQYVYSIRRIQRFQYFDEIRFRIHKKEKIKFKIAINIPSVRQDYVIEGILEIHLQNLYPFCLPMIALSSVPKIICLKQIYSENQKTLIIKISINKKQKKTAFITFKNLSNYQFTLEVQAISYQSSTGKPYDIITQYCVNCEANMPFQVNIQLIENIKYEDLFPKKFYIRKILLLRIRNSCIYYNYPMEVVIFERNTLSIQQ